MYNILPKPEKPDFLKNLDLLWLSGEGAGSWFYLEFLEEKVSVKRYTPDGLLEGASELHLLSGKMPPPKAELTIKYPSTLHVLNLEHNKEIVKFGKNY